jgi:hypothetical protein
MFRLVTKESPKMIANPNPELATPPITTTVDAEVDIEVLKTVPKQFAITDESTANWLVRKIISARRYAERVKQWAEQEQRRAAREEQTLMFLFGRQLEGWAKAEIEKLHNKKSLPLPAGTVGFRTIAPKLVVDDEHAVLRWAKENCPQAVVVVERLAKSVLDEAVEKTGCIPDDGAHIDQGGERFFIK